MKLEVFAPVVVSGGSGSPTAAEQPPTRRHGSAADGNGLDTTPTNCESSPANAAGGTRPKDHTMPKTVIFLFHSDDDSLNAGSHVAERVRQVAAEQGVKLEVYCFGPAQGALTEPNDETVHVEYRVTIDALAAAGVRVGACLNAANAAGTAEELTVRGITLEFARDAFVRYGLEGAAVISF